MWTEVGVRNLIYAVMWLPTQLNLIKSMKWLLRHHPCLGFTKLIIHIPRIIELA